ncbi:uncharacterized protein LOC114839834 [Esox lucius]|nr:uncharacterized protein LOC114839834 [Esox lucius]
MGQNSLSCEEKIRTRNTSREWNHRGRVSLFDNTGGNYIMVVIRQLTREDEGTYWCGVDKPDVPDSYTKVELEVKEDKCCLKSVRETLYLGGDFPLICNYPEKYDNSTKYFCKEDNDLNTCYYIISAFYDSESAKAKRFSLTDNKTEKSFTVTFSNLTEYDTGTYWCGVQNRTKDVLHYFSLITEVHLSVIDSTPASAPSATSHNTFGTLVVITVILVVVLFTLIFYIFYKRKCNTLQELISSSRHTSGISNTQPGNSEDMRALNTQLGNSEDMRALNTQPGNNEEMRAANQDPTYQTLSNSTNQDSIYQTLKSNSANQYSIYQTLKSNSANQDSIYQTLKSNSANRDSIYQTLKPNSAN